jgi:hypothetical protein
MTATGDNEVMTEQQPYEKRKYDLALRYFIIGQVGFYAFLIVCVLLEPSGLKGFSGFSHYGDVWRTALAYRAAFLSTTVFTLLSSFYLPDVIPFKALRFTFRVMIMLLFGIVITTGTFNATINNIHIGIGVALFLLQLIVGSWLAIYACRDRWNITLLILAYLGSLFALVALLRIVPFLIEGQVTFELMFALLVIRSLVMLRPH